MTKPWDGFGERLRAARHRAGLTQAQLSVKSGVGVRTVPAYETGTKPSLEEAQKIAEGLEVDVAWLLFGVTSENDIPAAIEQFIALNPKVTPEEAEQLRKVRWYHPHVELTLGMVEDAWREIRDAQSRGQAAEKPQIRPGRKPLAR